MPSFLIVPLVLLAGIALLNGLRALSRPGPSSAAKVSAPFDWEVVASGIWVLGALVLFATLIKVLWWVWFVW